MTFPELDPASAYSEIRRFRVLDVREQHEFRGPLGSVPGAEHVPLSSVPVRAEEFAGDRPLLLVCRSGKRSGKACELLQERGIGDVTNLAGGMIAWNRARLPVIRSEIESLGDLAASLVAWTAQVTAADVEAARLRIAALLARAGASFSEPTAAALDCALDALAIELRAAGAPPDLDLTLSAYRSDLAGF